jgi:hypothetical protein
VTQYTYETVLDKPGIYDLPVELYHRDPCPEPSLSASGIHTLLTLTPAHFAARHPKLTQWAELPEKDATTEQDLGSVVHALVLGKGAAFQVFDVDDWRGKRADLRDEARAAGKIPLKPAQYERASTLAERFKNALRSLFGKWPLGLSEQTIVWQRHAWVGDDRVMVWCRALTDHLVAALPLIIDLKGTGLAMDDASLSAKLAREGKDIQAAWYLEGLASVRPETAGRSRFLFLFGEFDPPFCIRPGYMPESWLAQARMRIDSATNKFAACLRSGEFPAWQTDAELQIPSWRAAAFEAAEYAEAL